MTSHPLITTLKNLRGEVNRNLPFILNIFLFGVGAVLTYLASRQANKDLTGFREAYL